MGKYNDFVQASEEEMSNMQKAYLLAENKKEIYDENFNITNNNSKTDNKIEICDNSSINNNDFNNTNTTLPNNLENDNENAKKKINENVNERNKQNLQPNETEKRDLQNNKEIEPKDLLKTGKFREKNFAFSNISNFLLLLVIIDLIYS